MKNNLWKCYLFNFLKSLKFFGAIAVPFFIDWMELSYTQMFVLESFFMLAIFLLEVPTGIIADKFSRKTSLILSSIFFALAMFLFAIVKSYYLFFLVELVCAVSFTLLSGADKALFYDSLVELKKEKEGKKYIARYDAFGTLGLVLAFPFGSLIAESNIAPYPETLPILY